MNIGIFAPMTGREAGGPETYDMELVKALSALDTRNRYTVYCVNHAAVPRLKVANGNFVTRRLRPSWRFVSIPISLPLELWRRPVDVLHSTFVAPPFSPSRMLFSLLDLSPFSHPDFFPPAIRLRLTKLFASSIRRASAIICISEFTRNDLLDRFDYPPERVSVTHLGVDPRYHRIADAESVTLKLREYNIDGPYILYVGKLQARKNTGGLLRAFHALRQQQRTPHKLVLAGRKTWTSSEIVPLIRELKLDDSIVYTGHVPDADLPFLYNGADVLAYPSLFEGFGLPVLEAMACGTPVVTSNTTALPEVAGGAAVLVDPTRPGDIAEALHRVVSSSRLREELRGKGFERARTFTWEATARKTLDVYRSFAS